MSVLYGDSSYGNRPRCWGRRDVYDSENRECRGCGVQSSCRDAVIKQTIAQQQAVPQVAPTFQQPYAYPYQQPYVAPQPAPAPVVTRYVSPPVIPPAPVLHPPVNRLQIQNYATPQPVVNQAAPTHVTGDWYGRVQDPLFVQIFSPPPFRPQMPGESFRDRLIKNIVLDGLTLIAAHIVLALRQMILPPSNK